VFLAKQKLAVLSQNAYQKIAKEYVVIVIVVIVV